MAEINVERKNENRNPIWPWILGALLLIGLIWGVSELLDRDDNSRMATDRTETTSDRGLAYDSEEDRVRNNATTGYEAQGPVQDYVLFADREGETSDIDRANVSDRNVNQNAQPTSEMAFGNEYISEGIRRLSAAIDAVASPTGMAASGTAGQTNTNSATRGTGSTETGGSTTGTTITGSGTSGIDGTTTTGTNETTTGTTADGGNLDQMHQNFKQRAERIQQNPQTIQSQELRATFVEAANLIAAIKDRNYPNSDADADEVRKAAEGVQTNRQISQQEDEVREFFRESSEALQSMDQQRFQDSDMNNQNTRQPGTTGNNR